MNCISVHFKKHSPWSGQSALTLEVAVQTSQTRVLTAPIPTPIPYPGFPEGDRAAGPAGNTAPGGRTEDPAPAELVPDGAGTPALPTDEAGGHYHPGIA